LNSVLAASAVTAVLMSPLNATAASDMFLKLGDLTGESHDKAHKGEIDVLSWSWGESKSITTQARGGGQAVPLSCITDLSLTKYIDSATPHIITSGIKNDTFPTAKLTIRKAGETPIEYFTITMSNVSIVSYTTGGSGGEDRLTENLTLHFNAAQGAYTPQDQTGKAGTPITWDVSENRGRGNAQCP
jgi:type VI secretion system secreted protein Hcp